MHQLIVYTGFVRATPMVTLDKETQHMDKAQINIQFHCVHVVAVNGFLSVYWKLATSGLE